MSDCFYFSSGKNVRIELLTSVLAMESEEKVRIVKSFLLQPNLKYKTMHTGITFHEVHTKLS